MANTPLSEHGLEVTGNVHWNLGWEELHEMAVSRKEAKYTSHGVLLATTGRGRGGHQMTASLSKNQVSLMRSGGDK